MILNKIDNKREFQIYVLINFIVSLIGIPIITLTSIGLIKREWGLYHFLHQYIGIELALVITGLFLIAFIFWAFFRTMNPAFIEVIINEKDISIKTYKPNIHNSISFILMLRYKNSLQEIKLSKLEYNDYKLLIDKFGFRKRLILQKINKTGLYGTSEINISLLGQKKYTDMILSIDRLNGKINLN